MPLFIHIASQWAFSEEVELATATPLWVPITILLLVLLIFVWGLTRGNVLDENMPEVDGYSSGIDQHDHDNEATH